MAPSTNPLIDRLPASSQGRKITAEDIQDFADQMNREDWVKRKGWFYFVRRVDGRAMLDRNDHGNVVPHRVR